MLKAVRLSVLNLLVLVCWGIGAGSATAADIAADVEYSYVERPGDLPDDYSAVAGTSLKYMSIKTADGFLVQAALWQPNATEARGTTLIVMVHGSGGNYARNPTSALSKSLSEKGFAALAINTRQHDDKRNTDNFFETSRDIDAAVQTAKALGYHSIVLQGHSLGTLQVLFYAATNWDRDIKAGAAKCFGRSPMEIPLPADTGRRLIPPFVRGSYEIAARGQGAGDIAFANASNGNR